MRRQFRITYDNWNNGACFIVHKPDGQVVRFAEHEGGLYFHDIGARKLPKIETSLAVVETVRGNKKEFTKRQVKEAEHSRRVYSMIGRPSINDYKNLVKGNLLHNFPVSLDDIKMQRRYSDLT